MEKRIEDWKDLRYGMFIHWGCILYWSAASG